MSLIIFAAISFQLSPHLDRIEERSLILFVNCHEVGTHEDSSPLYRHLMQAEEQGNRACFYGDDAGLAYMKDPCPAPLPRDGEFAGGSFFDMLNGWCGFKPSRDPN